ncbi:hypothetical protein PHMEG_0005538 [Phytophthora megakarya]|uniref:Uncharacterized protein n=1 Tax=Phytophthora megakarya TaxID=4795 RepID=A0A225WR85_9STRA|nr:hypothetical protein PHMEG_0005538 [Phytophthora megakarya]
MTPKQASIPPSLGLFDSTREERIYEVRDKLLSSSYAMGNPAFNVGTAVVNVLTAVIIYHYPTMAKVNPTGPAIRLVEQCVMPSRVTLTEILLWPQHLAQQAIAFQAKTAKEDRLPQNKAALDHHRALIEKLLDINSHLEVQLSSLEDMHNKTLQGTSQDKDDQQKKRPAEPTKYVPVKKCRCSETKPLINTWFEWSKKSGSKQIIAFMNLFLPNGYALDKKADNYKDQAKQVGDGASANLQAYLRENNISSSGSSAILKVLRKFHFRGAFNDRIPCQRRITCIFCIYPTRAMGLEELASQGDSSACFKKFLKTEIFGMYLAFNEGKQGKPLARNCGGAGSAKFLRMLVPACHYAQDTDYRRRYSC